MEEDEPISLPTSVPILMKHKVKTRNILSQDYEIQYSIKQGTNWLNMTKNYRSTRKGFVKRTCESIEMTPHSADNHKNNKMQPNLVHPQKCVHIKCVLLILFRKSHCRVPTSTPMKPIATVDQACGQWHKRSHFFVFRLPPGVCKASKTFTGTNGIHEFQFRSGFCQAVHIPWEDVDYDYNHDYYLLA